MVDDGYFANSHWASGYFASGYWGAGLIVVPAVPTPKAHRYRSRYIQPSLLALVGAYLEFKVEDSR